jgi:hypothetical protein
VSARAAALGAPEAPVSRGIITEGTGGSIYQVLMVARAAVARAAPMELVPSAVREVLAATMAGLEVVEMAEERQGLLRG